MVPADDDRPFATRTDGVSEASARSPDAAVTGDTYRQYYRYPPLRVATIDNNSKAVASLILAIFGIASCPLIGSIFALIFGYQARREIAASGGWQTGEKLARAGIITGWSGIALYVVLFIVIAIIAAVDAGAFSLAPGVLMAR